MVIHYKNVKPSIKVVINYIKLNININININISIRRSRKREK